MERVLDGEFDDIEPKELFSHRESDRPKNNNNKKGLSRKPRGSIRMKEVGAPVVSKVRGRRRGSKMMVKKGRLKK